MSQFTDNHVGILAIEVYFPSNFVMQTDLEQANAVSAGKYTIGLGQEAMAFTGDREDINSISLSVVQSLLEKYSISPNEIGRLEVGTESLVDKSKSTKTVLMSLFASSGNTDIDGATVVNACYGGTAALLNALTWADSSAWDGRYAIVVAADIAVYAEGPARPTGGCGSVAMLVGRNAPLRFDLRAKTTHAVWDFFKPVMDSEYPEVNGALSQTCYLRALDDCYTRFKSKNLSLQNVKPTVTDTDYFLFHSPYNKLVQKSFARLVYLDVLDGSIPIDASTEALDKSLESALKAVAAPLYLGKVSTGCEISRQIGNTYTASVYMNLAHLVSTCGPDLIDKKVVLFSYGSGALASMISISPTNDCDSRFSLEKIQTSLSTSSRLGARQKSPASALNTALQARESSHGTVPFHPSFPIESVAIGAFYLE
eukprot:gene33576-43393_t